MQDLEGKIEGLERKLGQVVPGSRRYLLAELGRTSRRLGFRHHTSSRREEAFHWFSRAAEWFSEGLGEILEARKNRPLRAPGDLYLTLASEALYTAALAGADVYQSASRDLVNLRELRGPDREGQYLLTLAEIVLEEDEEASLHLKALHDSNVYVSYRRPPFDHHGMLPQRRPWWPPKWWIRLRWARWRRGAKKERTSVFLTPWRLRALRALLEHDAPALTKLVRMSFRASKRPWSVSSYSSPTLQGFGLVAAGRMRWLSIPPRSIPRRLRTLPFKN